MKGVVLLLATLLAFSKTPDISDSSSGIKEAVCFIYHRFGDSRYPTTNVSTKDFESHLKYLVDNKFEILSFSDAITYLKSNSPAKKNRCDYHR